MQNYLLKIFVFSLVSIVYIGCSVPKRLYNLMPPAGLSQAKIHTDGKECLAEAQKLSGVPLTEEESRRVENIETGRFFQGGRGHSEFSDRYVLCYLNRNYQLLEK
jgi:hypothetical protein